MMPIFDQLDKHVVVVGYGSIGKRHYHNLRTIGFKKVSLVREGPARKGRFDDPPDATIYKKLSDVLSDSPWAVIVANTSTQHVRTAVLSLKAGAHVLLEKPIATDIRSARELLGVSESVKNKCSIAYCFRWHPLYAKLHGWVTGGSIGRSFHFHSWQASYLPVWHPYENYRESYAARMDLGGGVVRTLDHDLDMVRWIFGHPNGVIASATSAGGLPIDVEDTADMIFKFHDGRQASVHVSFARRDYCRGMWVVGESGSANLDWNSRTAALLRPNKEPEIVTLPKEYDLNAMYCDMVRDTLDGFAGSPSQTAVPLANGYYALAMALGALESSTYKKEVPLEDELPIVSSSTGGIRKE